MVLLVQLALLVVFLSPKRTLNLNLPCVYVKYVSHNFNNSYRRHVCNCRPNNNILCAKYAGIITVCLRTAVYVVHPLMSANIKLQSSHVIV